MQGSIFRYAWMHSRRDQILIVAIVLASLPFYWFSLELPKRIVNDAIQGRAFTNGAPQARLFELTLSLPNVLGGASYTLHEGILLAQLPYLLALSFVFLFLVLINGAFKYWINIEKGVLGERLLRRLRFDLFDRVMRFAPEDLRATKSAEVATMIKDEVEPIGAFFGEAFVTPAFLSTQALTALIFILVQNVWLGLIALAVMSTQFIIVPRLRREQLRLGRERQLESRRLAGRISELVDAAPTLNVHGVGSFARADVGDRLARLFTIRFALYRRKFAVKYLNNLIAQVTPFVFYTVGGYFALRGELDIGQLVAIIAAYRDLPPPIKELIDWDQQRADAEVKYEQVLSQFSRDLMTPAQQDDSPPPATDAPIVVTDLKVVDRRGIVHLERVSLSLDRPAHIALVGASGSGAETLARVIGRQLGDVQGSVAIEGRELSRMPHGWTSRFLVYAGSDPALVSGTMRDNIKLVLKRTPPGPIEDATLRHEAERTSTPVVAATGDWVDYSTFDGDESVSANIAHALRVVRGYDDVFRAGSTAAVGSLDAETAERLVAARTAIRDRLRETGLMKLVEPFDPERYNNSATVGENILFGVATAPSLMPESLATDSYLRAIIEAEGLRLPLLRIGIRVAETIVEVFGQMAPRPALLERYSLSSVQDVEAMSRLLQSVAMADEKLMLSEETATRLLGLGLGYVEPRHRLGLVDPTLRRRVLRARESFRRYLPRNYARSVEFYDPTQVMEGAPIIDNLLFGRVAYGVPEASSRLGVVVDAGIEELGLVPFVLRHGLDIEAGPGGRLLGTRMRTIVHLVRAVLRRPDILILDGAMSELSRQDRRATLDSIRREWTGRTLIVTFNEVDDADGFDRVLAFDGPSLARDETMASEPADVTRDGEPRIAMAMGGAR
jgi:putative ABC transport system ATP-binding protein